jgi:hypothetical protein
VSALVEQINQRARTKKADDARAAAELQAKAEAPPIDVVNIRNIRRGQGKSQPGSLMFLEPVNIELRPGDNLVDIAKLTEPVQAQLVNWINCGWVEVLPYEKQVSS